MSPKQYQKVIQQELSKINKVIDVKILKGEPYTRESKKHRALVKSLTSLQHGKSLFGRFNHSFSF